MYYNISQVCIELNTFATKWIHKKTQIANENWEMQDFVFSDFSAVHRDLQEYLRDDLQHPFEIQRKSWPSGSHKFPNVRTTIPLKSHANKPVVADCC